MSFYRWSVCFGGAPGDSAHHFEEARGEEVIKKNVDLEEIYKRL